MSTTVIPPYEVFLDTTGKPIENGYIYIGELNKNPETNPVTVYYDRAQTIVAPNPLRTVAGYPARAGSPSAIFAAGGYSITVKDKNGVLVYHSPANSDDQGGSQAQTIKNYIANSSFEDGTTTGWNLGRDTGTTVPLSGGIGGGTSEFSALTLNSTTPLAGLNSLSLNKPTGNVQSSTLYTDNLAIDREDLAGDMYVSFSYKTPASGYGTGDIGVFVWDVEGGALVTLSTNDLVNIAGAAGRFFAGFTPTASRTYRLILMFTDASNLAEISIDLDSLFFGATTLNAERLGGLSLVEMKKWAIEKSKQVGELFPLIDYKAPVAWATNPESYFPAVCLSTIASYTDVSDTSVPDLVTYLRAIKGGYRVGLAGQKTTFDVTNWAIASNVATLTFANTAAEIAFLSDLSEDQTVHGSFTNWRSITLPSAIGSITAGDYTLTGLNAAARTLTFAFTASNGGAAGAWTAEFYVNRVAGSTTTARLFAVQGRALVTANDSADEVVGGLRRRDRMQQITGSLTNNWEGAGVASGAITKVAGAANKPATGALGSNDLIFDSANSPGARTGTTTDPRSLGVHLYIHAGRKLA